VYAGVVLAGRHGRVGTVTCELVHVRADTLSGACHIIAALLPTVSWTTTVDVVLLAYVERTTHTVRGRLVDALLTIISLTDTG